MFHVEHWPIVLAEVLALPLQADIRGQVGREVRIEGPGPERPLVSDLTEELDHQILIHVGVADLHSPEFRSIDEEAHSQV